LKEKWLMIILAMMLDEPTHQLMESTMNLKTNRGQNKSVISLMIVALVLTLASVQGSIDRASADEVSLPAGLACANFPLTIATTGDWPQNFKEFLDKDGNVVSWLLVGKGVDFVFTNGDTGVTFSLKGKGSVSRYFFNPDGSYMFTGTGQNVIILFPTDPGGPSTKEYLGTVSFTADADGSWSPLEASGSITDICAALQ